MGSRRDLSPFLMDGVFQKCGSVQVLVLDLGREHAQVIGSLTILPT